MKKYRIIQFFLLSLALLIPFTGCAEKKQEIDWELYGTWIAEDGTIGEPVSFSIEGQFDTINVEPGNHQIVDLHIRWPEGFRFGNEEADPFSMYAFCEKNDTNFIWMKYCGFAFDPIQNIMTAENITLSPERGYVVVCWSQYDGNLVVGSTDPETDPKDILDWYVGLT